MFSIGQFARLCRLSPKALRLYDELGILPPARVDADTGYRWYESDQIEVARRVAMMRQVGLPLELVRQVLSADALDVAALVQSYWRQADAEHHHRAALVRLLVERLEGMRPVMYEVTRRWMPERPVLCMECNVTSQQQVVELGKQFLGYFRDRPTPLLPGRQGAPFLVYHGEVSGDSDGPVEFCRPISHDDSETVASRYPELRLRSEAAHEEAVVHLGTDPQDGSPWEVVFESLYAWTSGHSREPSDLGVRLTYLVVPPRSAESAPDVDVAVPLVAAGEPGSVAGGEPGSR